MSDADDNRLTTSTKAVLKRKEKKENICTYADKKETHI